MFRAPCHNILEMLFKKALNDCNGHTKCVSTLVKLMKKNVIRHRMLLVISKGYLGYMILQGLNLTIAVWTFLLHKIWKVCIVLCNN